MGKIQKQPPGGVCSTISLKADSLAEPFGEFYRSLEQPFLRKGPMGKGLKQAVNRCSSK